MSIRFIQFVSSRWTRLALVASVMLGFQTTLFNDMRPFGVMAQVMVLFAACAGVIYGAEIGTVAGLIVGLMYDCVLTTPLGLASLVLGTTAFVAGAFPYFVRESNWWNKAIAVYCQRCRRNFVSRCSNTRWSRRVGAMACNRRGAYRRAFQLVARTTADAISSLDA